MHTKYWYWLWRTFIGPSRLRRKFVRTFLFAGIVPLVLMGVVSVYLVTLTHRIDVASLEKTVALQAATEAKKVIDDTASFLQLTVTFEQFLPIAFEPTNNQQSFLLESVLREDSSITDAAIICTTGSVCDHGVETSRWVRSGATIAPTQVLRQRAGDPEFISAQKGQTYISPVQFASATPYAIFAAPVLNKRGEVIGVLSAVVMLEKIQAIATDVKLGEGGYVFLTNDQGYVIAHPDRGQIGSSAAALPPVRDLIANNAATETHAANYQSATGSSVSGAATLVERTHWIAVAEWPRQETEAIVRTILLQIAGFTILSLIIIAIIASRVAFRLIQPIAQLNQGTSVIGGGNFNYRVHIKTGDELEDLGANLNKMAENLKGLEEVRALRMRTDLLAESLRKEQELSKLKDQFITTVSHQFNTPLAAINWALSPLNEARVNPQKMRESIDIIAKSQKEIAAIVSDLLTLSEIGFQYQKTKTKQTDIAGLAQKIIDAFSPIARARNISLALEKKTSDAVAQVNEFTMTKALENLIDNAIGYSNDGGSVSVTLSGDDAAITVSVADAGIGIPADDQQSIFQQFFRAKNAVIKKNVGTGLGLYIVKTIVEGHGGTVSFTSAENQGSTFVANFPRA